MLEKYYFIDSVADEGHEIFFTDFDKELSKTIIKTMKKDFKHSTYDIIKHDWYFQDWIDENYIYCIWVGMEYEAEENYLKSLGFIKKRPNCDIK